MIHIASLLPAQPPIPPSSSMYNVEEGTLKGSGNVTGSRRQHHCLPNSQSSEDNGYLNMKSQIAVNDATIPALGALESLIRLEVLEKPPKLTPGSWKGVIEADVLSVTARAEISRDSNNRNAWSVSGAHKELCKLPKEFSCYPRCCRKCKKGVCRFIQESK